MKKNSNWSPVEIAFLQNGALSDKRVAELTGRSRPAIRGRRQRMNFRPAVVQTTVGEDITRHQNDYWRGQYDLLRRKYEAVLKDGSAAQQLIELAASLAPQSYQPAPAVETVRQKAGKHQSAVLMLTDTHVGADIKPEQTLGFGGYNFNV